MLLLRSWSQGACVHILRQATVTTEWCQRVDGQLVAAVEAILSGVLNAGQVAQLFMKIKDGGMGMGSAVWRREAAWVGAWESGFKDALTRGGFTNVQSLRAMWPEWHDRAAEVQRHLKTMQGGERKALATNWEYWAGMVEDKRQHKHTQKVYEAMVKAFHQSVSAVDSLAVLMCTGPEANAHLLAGDGDDGSVTMSDVHLKAAIRRKLRFGDPVPNASGKCMHKQKQGRVCGRCYANDNGRHAVTCALGGGRMQTA